jgi:hypothetical protein
MHGFLKHHFNTEKIQNVDMNDLKLKINGESVIARLKYRGPASSHPTKKLLNKNEIYRFESNHSKHLAAEHQHEEFGFSCLNFAVSESSRFIKIWVQNKKRASCSVGVRTVIIPDSAVPEKDFAPIDEVIDFKNNEWHEI